MSNGLRSFGGKRLNGGNTHICIQVPTMSSEKRRKYAVYDGKEFISKAPQGCFFALHVGGNRTGRSVSKESITKLLNDYLFTIQLIMQAFPNWIEEGFTLSHIIRSALWEISYYNEDDIIRYTEAWRKMIHNRINVYRGKAKKALNK